MRLFFLFFSFLLLISCNDQPKELSANKIVDKAIEKAGGHLYERSRIEFNFRGRKYISTRDGGKFELERFRRDSTGGEIHDILSNSGLNRYVDDSLVKVPDSLVESVSNSVNSVHYFAQLPYGLDSPAVNKNLVGKDSIKGKSYYEVKVTFDATGGGSDHQDEYLYWINTSDFTVDYLAYNYEVNGGGVRFRKAFNVRKIGGLRFADYRNYSYPDLSVPLEDLDSLYLKGKLHLVSTIKTENVKVSRLKDNK